MAYHLLTDPTDIAAARSALAAARAAAERSSYRETLLECLEIGEAEIAGGHPDPAACNEAWQRASRVRDGVPIRCERVGDGAAVHAVAAAISACGPIAGLTEGQLLARGRAWQPGSSAVRAAAADAIWLSREACECLP